MMPEGDYFGPVRPALPGTLVFLQGIQCPRKLAHQARMQVAGIVMKENDFQRDRPGQ